MPLSERENYLRTVTMTGPEWIPATVVISRASWWQWRGEMENVLARHPVLFPGFVKGQRDFGRELEEDQARAAQDITDSWGCVWHYEIPGLDGIVVRSPLEDWAALETWHPPLPPSDSAHWEQVRQRMLQRRREGKVASAGVPPHGFLLMRLYYLRGYDNLMMDIAAGEPRLQRLIDLILEHYRPMVERFGECGIDILEFADDQGTQTASMLGPKHLRRWLMPAYQQLMRPLRERGIHVGFHTDGYIMDIMDEIIECGANIVNPQDLCNGIDVLAHEVKGRVCIRLDIDRQRILPFGTRRDIRALIEEEARQLGSPRGGLDFICGVYPPTPPENVDALCCALEEFRTYWWDGRAPVAGG
jgi:uroporphyrinogen decarboxylase